VVRRPQAGAGLLPRLIIARGCISRAPCPDLSRTLIVVSFLPFFPNGVFKNRTCRKPFRQLIPLFSRRSLFLHFFFFEFAIGILKAAPVPMRQPHRVNGSFKSCLEPISCDFPQSGPLSFSAPNLRTQRSVITPARSQFNRHPFPQTTKPTDAG